MNTIIVQADLPQHRISPHLYGHFAEHLGRCVYDGLWVGTASAIPNVRGWRSDIIEALKAIAIPNLRWPGGCFADTYNWRDGVGPPLERPSMINIHWGGTLENNHVGTHEFFDLCDQIGCEPYIAANVGSGTPREMSQWLEYITMPQQSPMAQLRQSNGRDEPWPVKYWGIGNENWGCGGNMRAEFYADLYRQFACYARHFTLGRKLYRVACGLEDEWNDIVLKHAAAHMDGLSIHYYTIPHTWANKGSATDFNEAEWKLTLQKASGVDDFLTRTTHILNRHDPAHRVHMILDEWGTWYEPEPGANPAFLYQQNTLRDALVAAVSFNIFYQHAERLHMANIAQLANVLQALVLTDGPRMLLTPTYHVFDLYQPHKNARTLPVTVDSPEYVPALETVHPQIKGQSMRWPRLQQVSATASLQDDGTITLSLINLHHADEIPLRLDLRGRPLGAITGRILTADTITALNTFDHPDTLAPQPFNGFSISTDGTVITLPPRSIVTLQIPPRDS